MGQHVRRRDVIRAVPLVVFGSAIAGLGRFLVGCSAEPSPSLRTRGSATDPTPTDDDEYVPPTGEPPVVANETPPVVPNAQWEARARQLEDDQARIYGPVFTQEAPGPMAGKEKSHVPEAKLTVENGLARVTVLVFHVMGKNGLDAGAVDAASAADAADAGRQTLPTRHATRRPARTPVTRARRLPCTTSRRCTCAAPWAARTRWWASGSTRPRTRRRPR